MCIRDRLSGDEQIVIKYMEQVAKENGMNVNALAKQYQASVGAISKTKAAGAARLSQAKEAALQRKADLAGRGAKVKRFKSERIELQKERGELTAKKGKGLARKGLESLFKMAVATWVYQQLRKVGQ